MPDPDDKEEGEIEDGEIIESGDEGGAENENGSGGNNSRSMMELLYMEMEGKGNSEVIVKKKKKKRKKKKKNVMLSPSTSERGEIGGSIDDLNPPKAKKARYVDHDRVADCSDNPWYKPFGSGPPPPASHAAKEQPGPGFYSWSPERLSPDENDPHSKQSREKSPPGLYDSPYESGDEMGDEGGIGPNMFQSLGNFERDGLGGGRQGANRKNRRRRVRGGDKRGGHRDGTNKRRNQRPLQAADTQHLICKFYLEGKCVKGDVCNYSHDVANKKMELCKFYLNGFCSKIESCIYLHNEFPCKFYHTGAQCYSADNCKFSHDVLSDEMRKALDIHLAKDNKSNNSPNRSDGECSIQPRPHRPSLLGSPPQHIKDMVMRKKIPSLFDLEIQPPVYQAGVGVGTTVPAPTAGGPAPAPGGPAAPVGPPVSGAAPPAAQGPLLPTPNSDFRSNFRDGPDGNRQPLLPLPTSTFDPDPQDYFNFDQDMRAPYNQMDPGYSNGAHSFNPINRHFGSDPASMMDVDERYPPISANCNDNEDMYMPNDFDEDERVNEVIRHPDHQDLQHDSQPFNPIPWRNLAVSDVDMRSNLKNEENSDSSCGNVKEFYSSKSADRNEELFGAGLDHSSSSDSEDEVKKTSKSSNIQVPLHLPKKQRELFMRIQQREAANKAVPDTDEAKKTEENIAAECPSNVTAEKAMEDEEDKEAEKERWYSSSEDDDDDNDQPLAAMLKNLQQQPLHKPTSATTTVTSSLTSTSSTSNESSMLQLTKILQSITSKPAAGAAVPNPVAKVDPRRDPRRDPRSSRGATSSSSTPIDTRDPRSKVNRLPPPPIVTQQQSSQPPLPHFNSNPTNSDSGIGPSGRLVDRLANLPPIRNLPSSRPPALEPTSKPKPIVARKRSSASEEELVEVSHSKSSSNAAASSSSSTSSAAHHLIPYKLHAVNVSVPNYSGLVHAVNKTVDPKQLLCDPRLKKELANEFSVLSGASESSSLSSREKTEVTNALNQGNSVVASETKVKVGQHRLGVATMPAPRMKPTSTHLKKVSAPVIGTIIPSLGLLREPERSTTPPVLMSNKLKDLVVAKDSDLATKLDNKESESVRSPLSGREEPQSILSPTAEPTRFEYQPKTEPKIELAVNSAVVVVPVTKTVTEPEPTVSAVTGETKMIEQMKSPPPTSVEFNDKLLDSLNNFDDDADDDDDKSDNDLVIVEPEVEKSKKVKKPAKKVSTNSKPKSDDDKKKSIFMVSQVGTGTCIKIKMIKPTKQSNMSSEENKKETKAVGAAPTKVKASSKSNGKRVTRSTKQTPSFEDALNSNGGQKSDKKVKKHVEKTAKQGEKNKQKSVKNKKNVDIDVVKDVSMEIDETNENGVEADVN